MSDTGEGPGDKVHKPVEEMGSRNMVRVNLRALRKFIMKFSCPKVMVVK